MKVIVGGYIPEFGPSVKSVQIVAGQKKNKGIKEGGSEMLGPTSNL